MPILCHLSVPPEEDRRKPARQAPDSEVTMATQTAPVFAIQRSGDRAFFDFGWLKTHHSFSFADYFDPENLSWGALRVFNDDTVLPGQGFGTHPHRDMEIVTYVLRGELEHRDSLGHHGVVAPGGIQYVSAGTGVRHSEFNHSKERDVHFVQMWVLPRSSGEPPAYGQHAFAEDERRNRWLVATSGQPGVDAPVALRADASLRVAKLEDGALTHAFGPSRRGFLFVAEGAVTANGERLATGDAVRIQGACELDVRGSGELVLWDVAPAGTRSDDA
jgi:redox-sensitive bicupin YhaK (pirin superfamily)